MKKITMNEINATINKNKKYANKKIWKELPSSRRKKTRTRKNSERAALDEIAIARWDKAIESGKIKKLAERRLYYDYN